MRKTARRMRLWITRAAWLAVAVIACVWRDELVGLVEHCSAASLAVRVGVYGFVYVTLAGLAVPGAVLLTVLAGSLFGVGLGTIIASFVSTLGASLAFLASRQLLLRRPAVVERMGSAASCSAQDGSVWGSVNVSSWDLLLLRLMPVVPYFTVNLLAGRSRLPLAKFWLVSQVGMLPATFLLVRCGALLSAEPAAPGMKRIATLWPLLVVGLLVWCTRTWIAIRRRRRDALDGPDHGPNQLVSNQ